MAALCKVVFQFYANGGYGFQEIHWFNYTGSSQPADLNSIIAALEAGGGVLGGRLGILCPDVYIQGIRVSTPVAGAIASKVRKYSPNFYVGNFPGNTSSQNDSLAMVMYDTTNTKKSITHIRGVPNSVILSEQYVPTNGFLNALNAYGAALVGFPFGWPSKLPGAPAPATGSLFGSVTGYTVSAITGLVTFTCTPASASSAPSTLDPTKTYEVRFSKINRSYSDLNRTFVCNVSVGPPLQFTTVNQVAAGPFLSPGRFSLSIPGYTAYGSFGYATLGERRMGRPIGRYPGRARKRPTV
jgi:hypothetical protein